MKEKNKETDEKKDSRVLRVIKRLRTKDTSPERRLDEVVSYRERLLKKAASQRSAHKRKDARAHVKKTRPHNKAGRARATSRITRSAGHKLSYGQKSKSREGKFSQKQMMTHRKGGGLDRMRRMFRMSGRLDYTDRRRTHADTRSMRQTKSNRRSTHLRSSYEYPQSQILREETDINKEKSPMSSLDCIKEARKSLITELLQNAQDKYGVRPQYYKGKVNRGGGSSHHKNLKIKRGVVQAVRDSARSSQKSREEYVKQMKKMQDLEAARAGQ